MVTTLYIGKSNDSRPPFCIKFLYSEDFKTSLRNFLYPRLPVSFVISPIYESGKLVLISMGFLGYNNSFEKFFPNSDSGKAAPTYYNIRITNENI